MIINLKPFLVGLSFYLDIFSLKKRLVFGLPIPKYIDLTKLYHSNKAQTRERYALLKYTLFPFFISELLFQKRISQKICLEPVTKNRDFHQNFEFLTEPLQKVRNFENLHDRPSPKN